MKFFERLALPHLAFALVALSALGFGACGGKTNPLPSGATNPDKFLFERGTESLNKRNYIKAREYFQQLYDNYPQSGYRTEAKLGLGDAYLGEGSAESLVLAANEFREFLTFFPTNPRADYAQYKLGLAHFAQMLRPDRDQAQTRDAIKELQTFVERYPSSKLMPEGRKKLREAQDRLSESDFLVGYFYFKTQRWYPGAIARLMAVLKLDPEYSHKDKVYYYLAESLLKVNRPAEALPYFEKLVEEYHQSEFLSKAQLRIKELKVQKG